VLTEVQASCSIWPALPRRPAARRDIEARARRFLDVVHRFLDPSARRQGLEHARAIYALADKRLGENEWPWRSLTRSPTSICSALLALRIRRSAPGEFPNIEAH